MENNNTKCLNDKLCLKIRGLVPETWELTKNSKVVDRKTSHVEVEKEHLNLHVGHVESMS